HNYEPSINISPVIEGNILYIDLTIDNQTDSASVSLPNDSVSFDIFDVGDNSYIFKVNVNGETDEDILNLPNQDDTLDVSVGINSRDEIEVTIQLNEQFVTDSAPLPSSDVTVEFYELNDNQFGLAVTVGDRQGQDSFAISSSENSEHVESNLQVSLTYAGNFLQVAVADGESSDFDSVFIDAEVINNYDGGGGNNMNCDQLSQDITDCCQQILSAINNLSNVIIAEIDDSENNLKNEIDSSQIFLDNQIQKVEDYLTIEVKADINTDYTCEFELDENGDRIPAYAISKVKQENIDSVGLSGIVAYLKTFATNLDAIHSDICKAIDPISSVGYSDFYEFCDNSNINRADFDNTELGQSQYEAAIQAYLQDLLANSKYGYLIGNGDQPLSEALITAPNNWITPILADFALIQSRINKSAICEIELLENPEVVSLVASPKYVTNIDGEILTIHFVNLDAYPTRRADQGYRPIHIPAPKESFEWNTDFLNLRQTMGNQYGEMELNGYKSKVSGWFSNIDAGNSFFDAILTLTTATEINRNFPNHSNPRTDIVIRETRPYRAYISRVLNTGEAETLFKYFPPADEEEN
ncbi:hypothetical protein I4641_23400, partial [Waterburya agarophytonicola K14]